MARLSGLPSCHDVAQTTELIVVVGVLLFCVASFVGNKAGRKFGHFDIFEASWCKAGGGHHQGIISASKRRDSESQDDATLEISATANHCLSHVR